MSTLSTLYLLQDPKSLKILTPGVSNDAVDDLQKALPQLRIEYRGRAFMGISGEDRPVGCRVRQLQADSPAEKAKVMPGDIISQFDGKPIRNFHEMIQHIAEKQPNDVVKLEVLRGNENDLQALEHLQTLKDPGPAKELLDELRKRLTKEVEVTLGEWK